MTTRRPTKRYLSYHLERTLSYIMFRVVRADFRPAPIAYSLAARDLRCSNRTWGNDTRQLAHLGLIAREVRRGRGRGRGGAKNPGSLYSVNWKLVAVVVVEFKTSNVPHGTGSEYRQRRTLIEQLLGSTDSEYQQFGADFQQAARIRNIGKDGRKPSFGRKEAGRDARPGLTAERPAAADLPDSPTPLPPAPNGGGGTPPLPPSPPATSSAAFQQAKNAVHHTLRRSK